MNVEKFRQFLRNFKSQALYKYYQFRVESEPDSYKIWLRNTPYRVLLLLSHMRSGSSLLTHILSSNPTIVGYGETHLSYDSERDFKKLFLKVYRQNRSFNMSHRYILDKILHDQKLNQTCLHSKNIYAIFLLREPYRTLESLLKLKPHWDEENALNYYVGRLSTLEEYAKIINSKERSLFLTYEQLLEQTDSVFKALKNFLGTRENFSEEYQVLRTTGMRGIGDPSEKIKSGRIIRNSSHSPTRIPSDLVDRGNHRFDRCCQTLTEYCQIVQ